MNKTTAFSGMICAATLILSACSQKGAIPPVITPEPVFNKFGNTVGCTAGGILTSTANGATCVGAMVEETEDECDRHHPFYERWPDGSCHLIRDDNDRTPEPREPDEPAPDPDPQ